MLESAGVDLPRLQLAAGALRATSDSAAFAALAEPRLRGGRPRRPSVCARPRVAAIPRRSGVMIDRRWPERARARAAGRVLDALGRSVAQPAARSMTIGTPKMVLTVAGAPFFAPGRRVGGRGPGPLRRSASRAPGSGGRPATGTPPRRRRSRGTRAQTAGPRTRRRARCLTRRRTGTQRPS